MTREIQVAERSGVNITHPWWPKPLAIRVVARCNLRECDRYVAVYRDAGEEAEHVGYCTAGHATLARKDKGRRRGLPLVTPEPGYIEVWTPPEHPTDSDDSERWTGPGGTCRHRRRYFRPTSQTDGCAVCLRDAECCDSPELHEYDLTVRGVTVEHPQEAHRSLTIREVVRCNLLNCMSAAVVYRRPGDPPISGYCRGSHRDRARDERRDAMKLARDAEKARLERVARTEKRLADARRRREQREIFRQVAEERNAAHGEALAEAESRRRIACPRPDKNAWKTFEGAEQEVRAMRAKNHPDGPWLHPYLCNQGGPTGQGCGTYHVGNRLHHPGDEVVARWGLGVS